MAKPNYKKLLTTVLKIAISILAVFYVVYKLDFETKRQIKESLQTANFGFLFLGFLFFNISKIISSIRLNRYFKCIDLHLSEIFNGKLYYLGMFYNLFLPGGIGGDGYKIYYLNKNYQTPAKKLISATILDRLSGVVVLGFLALILALISTLQTIIPAQNWTLILLTALTFPIFWIIHNWLFKIFNKEFVKSIVLGFGVQLSQLVCAAFILWSLTANGLIYDYMTLFLVSSVVAVLPFTVGGVGARELAMLEGVALFSSINGEVSTAISFSILFFVITAISSFIGIIFSIKLK